ncbi:MAG: Hsp20 family protein [Pseudomonadota bacterium]
MNRLSGFTNPLMLGFDELERVLDRVGKSGNDGYPPYNIEKIASGDDKEGDMLRITLAVAGFSDEELDISVEENQLMIRGKQVDDRERVYLHRGIAARQFQKAFVLADGMEVTGAELRNGLLSIDLMRLQPERIIRKIAISSRE